MRARGWLGWGNDGAGRGDVDSRFRGNDGLCGRRPAPLRPSAPTRHSRAPTRHSRESGNPRGLLPAPRRRLAPLLLAAAALLLAPPAALAQSVSITSTPANGTHYVTGDVITTRISGLQQIAGGAITTAQMRITVGSTERRARSTSSYVFRMTQVNFAYTVTAADFDADGIAIPANSIVGGAWFRVSQLGSPLTAANRNHAALANQAAHKVHSNRSASISATSPASLTEATLHNATVSVSLTGDTFAAGVLASHFEPVGAIPGLTVSQVSGASSGSAAATLTLSFTGDFSVPATLAIRVKPAALTLTGTDGLTTATVAVAPTDEAPSWPAIADLYVQRGVAMTPVQLPAATGGNGALDYSLSGALPAGMKFDATGADATGCTAADFPAGYADTANLAAAPRVLCGTPTAGNNPTIVPIAHDADANRASTDSARGSFVVFTYGASVSATSPSALTEANLNGATVTVALEDTTFAAGVTKSSFALAASPAIAGLSVDSVSGGASGSTTATLTLAFTGGFDAVRTLAVRVKAAAHQRSGDLATGTVNVTPTPGIALGRTALALEEDPAAGGGTNAHRGTYTLALAADPTPAGGGYCAVNVEVASNNPDVTVDTDQSSLTKRLAFDGSDWSTAQTVTVTAAGDADGVDDVATISHRRVGGGQCGGFFGRPTLPAVTVTVNDDETPGAAIASPSILTAATLSGAAVTVSLDKTTFGSGVGASSFQLVTSPAVAGLTVGSVSGGASGSTSATLNLSWSGTTLAADAKLKVRVLAAAHAGDAYLETAEIDVLAAADTAPSFPSRTLPAKYFPVGAAIRPFQIPAASGGNGAISYEAINLSARPGLKFDATGTDPGGCPSTTPRTVCGTPTATGASVVTFSAQDADSNQGPLDRSSIALDIYIYGASISSSPLTEANLNTATVAVSLAQTTFGSGVTVSSFDLVTDIPNISISGVSGGASGSTTATLTLAFTGDFSTDRTLAVKVKAAAHARSADLTTDAVDVLAAADTAPSFPSRTLPAKYFPVGAAIQPFQIPAATGGNGAISYEAINLSARPGLKFDATGTDPGGCPGTTPRTVCGTPTATGASVVTFSAQDADSNQGPSDRSSIALDIYIYGASISSPNILTAATLNGAAVTVSLDRTTFASGVGSASFELATSPAVAGLTVGSVSGGASGSASATLNLSWSGTTLAADAKLKVRVLAAAHARSADLTTDAVDVLAAADTAPSFPSRTLPAKYFPVGAAIQPFQIPAATGGNGAISYRSENLSRLPGLKFDATGTDPGGCPGTTPRTVCGTPTATGASVVTFSAQDADSNQGPSDRSSIALDIYIYDASISSPNILTAATLNGAAVTVSLDRTTFASGVGAASFELITSPAIAGLTVGSVSGGASGSASATLNLSWSGTTLAADAKLKVRVLAAAHAGDAYLETAEIDVLAAADTAPSFPSRTLPAKYFPVGAAIRPFQIPAASGGNGAISYEAINLSARPGLKFDATGTDPGGCPGTMPRTVCGTPTATGASVVTFSAQDADSNQGPLDRSSIALDIYIYGASISSSPLTEANLNTATVAVSLAHTTFGAGVTASSFELVTDIPNVSISGVSGGASGSTTATLTLAFTGDFSTDRTLAVKVKAAAHARSGDLTTATVTVTPTDTAPAFARGWPATGFPSGAAIVPFQLPAASGGNGAVTYAAAGLPAGLKFDATGADATGCTAADFPTGFTDAANLAAAPRVVCGTPTRDGASIVVVTAHDADANRAAADRARLSFTFTVAAPAAALAWSLPPALTEASLHGATLGVSLKQSAFVAGAGASGFALVSTVPSLSIARVSDVAEGGTTATLTLAFTGDWRGAGRPLAVRVLAAAHRQAGDLTTGAVTVPPAPGLALAPATSAASRLRTTEAGDTATFTVRLDRAPSGNVVLDVTSSDTGEGTVLPARLTFTPSDWNTAQTVTLTGVDDAPTPSDPNPSAGNRSYTVSVAVDAAATADDGYDGLAAATVYAVNADDEYGLDVGAVTGQATEAGGQATFTVALRTQPSAAVTVAVSSRDAGEGTVEPASLTFAAAAWNTGQTVTVTGVQDPVDDGDVTWQVRLDSSSGDTDYAGVGDVDVPVTTADDDGPPGVALALDPATLDESGAATVATVSATLSHPSGAATTVTVSAGTAWTAGADAAIVIAAGATANASDTATVVAADNATDEPDRTGTATATIANDRAAADGTTMVVTGAALTVRDDDAAPGVTLALAPASVSENGGIATVTATLSNPSSEPSTVTVAAVSGSYTVGTDATITIAAGATTAASDTVLVTAVDDSIHQGSAGRSATVTAALANGQGAGAVTGAALTLTDDETLPTVAFVLSSSSISETGGVSTVTATLSGPSSEAVTVTVAAAAGTGAVAADFALSTATTLTIAAGATTSAGVVTVTANGNDVDSPNKSVTVSGAAVGGNSVANPPAVTLTLEDDETLPTVALVLTPTSISETGGVSTVTATLSGPSSEAVTVTVAAAGAGAVAGDFTLSTATTLTLAAGATTSAGVVTVTANGNDVDSPNKSVTVSGTAAGGNSVADPPDVTLTLEDDDALPTVALALSSTSISETGGISTVTATLSGPSSEAVTVTVAAAAGTGAVSADFTLSTATTLTLAVGATTSAGVVTVTANGNAVDSPNKSVTVSGTAAGGNSVADPSDATLTLEDDDALPTVALVLSSSSITETGGVSTVTATLSGPSSEAVTVTVAASAGTGAVVDDFTLSTATTLTLAAGATTSAGTVTVTANGNDVDAANKSVTVSGTAAGGNSVADPPDVTLTLEDDDALPTVALVLTPSSISETGGVSTVTATLSGPSSEAVTVTVAAAAVSPAVAGDFTLSAATTLTLAAGQTTSAGTVTVAANGNDVDAANKSVTVSGTATGGNSVASPSNATLTLTDDDTAGVSVSPATSTTSRLRTTESGGTATFTVRLDSEPTGDVALDVASTDTDEGTVMPATLTFTASDWSTAQTVTLTGVDDSPPAADGSQSYTVTLTVNQTNTADSSYDALSALTVYAVNADNEYGLDVGSVTGQATEAGGTAAFTVALLTQPSAAVTVAVTSRDEGEGLVSAGGGAPAASTTLTFAAAAWSTAQTVTVTGVQDPVDDGTVAWTVRLDPASGDADYDALDSEDVSVSTTDDDGPPTVTLTLNPASIAESGTGNVATVTARLSHPSGAATTVTVSAGTAWAAGTDATIVIAAGATANASDTATVVAADNATDEPDRTGTVTATITNARAAADGTTMAVTGVALTVEDDDAAPTAALSLSPASVSENGGLSTVTATLSHPSSEPSTVTVTAGSGASGLYTVGLDATITIAAGSTTAASDTATVTGVDDAVHQGSAGRSATVTATLANGQGAGAVTGAALTLSDDETLPTVALALGPASISEEGGVSTVSATLSGVSSEAVTVTVAAAAGSGAVSGDFALSTATTLTLAAGATTSSGVVTVRANGNNVASGSKQVVVSGTAAGGNGVANPANTTLTLTDDDTPRAALALSSSSITENGGIATVTATLDRQSSIAVTVTVAAAPVASTGAVAGDFTLSTATTLTFVANATTSTGLVTVTGNDDATDAPDKRVTVSGTASDGLGLANDPPSVTLTLTDDEGAPGVVLSLNPSSVSENGGTSTVSATLSHPSSEPSTVTVTAVSGFYTVGDATITIAAGDTTAASDTATVTAVDDAVHQGSAGRSATVTAALTNGQGAGAVTGATLTLTDDETLPTVALVLGPSSISESGGVSTVTATLSGASSAALTVTVAAAAGTGAAAADFTLSTATTLTFAAGSTTSAGVVTVTANGNAVDAPDKSVTVSGASSGGNGVANPSNVTLTITDDEATATATLVLTPPSILENGGLSTVTARLSHPTTEATTLTVSAAPVSPAVAGDFMLSATTTLTLAAGATASTGTVTVTAVDNAGASGRRQVRVSATATGGRGVAAPSDATLVIRDDEFGLNESAVTGQATEGGGQATFTVALQTQPSAAVTVSMTRWDEDGLVVDESEGRVEPSSLVFTTGSWETAQTVTVTGVDDDVDDGDVAWRVRLDPSSADADYDGLDPVDVAVSTTDDDAAPAVTLALTPPSIAEAGGVSTVTATLSHPSSAATTVTVSAAPVAPAVAGDFTLSAATMLTIAAGSIASTGTVTVTAVDNRVDAADKTVAVSGTAANSRAGGDGMDMTVTAATLTIADDDEKGLAFADGAGRAFAPPSPLAVAEGDPAGAPYTVTLTSRPVGTVTVAVASDNAEVEVSPGRLTFAPSDWNEAQTVTVTAHDDGDDYADAAVLTHTATGGGYDDGDAVVGTLAVAVDSERGTKLVVGGAGETTYRIGGRTVTVVVRSGVPEGIELDLEALPDALSHERLTLAFAPVEAPAASDAYTYGSAGARTVVDVAVTEGAVPSAGLRLCLPVVEAVRAAARGRALRLLRHDGGAWTEVAGSAEGDEGTRVCAGGVAEFSPFAVGYPDTAPEFTGDFAMTEMVFTVDEAIEVEPLPEAEGGDRTRHELGPRPLVLPPGLDFDDGAGEDECPGQPAYTLCGTPTEEFAKKKYTWTATDIDGESDALELTIEVVPAVARARARLKAVNESVLPEVARASWASAMEAVSRRLGSAAGGGSGVGSGASGEGLSAALAGFMRSNEQALEEGGVSWKELWSGQSFAVALGGKGEGEGAGAGLGGPVTVWGAGERRSLSRDTPALAWSGELFAAHLGADVGLGSGLTGGAGVSWFESGMDYTDRSGDDGPVEGVHRSWMASVQPYLGWSSGSGARLWGALGYGAGEVEIVDEALVERYGRQRSGSELRAVAAGGAVRLVSGGAAWVDLKGEGQATRYEVDENGSLIEGLSVRTQRLRLAMEGAREYALDDGARLAPSAELGVRWDGGDGATGTGVEVGGGLSWSGPGLGTGGALVMEVGGRWLVAHRGDVEEWGVSGGVRLEPRGTGRGLSLRVEPSWGEAGSGTGRLWEEGVAGRGSSGGGRTSGVGVEAELGYGLPAFGDGVGTPYTRLGQAPEGERRYGLGWRLDLPGEALGLDVEGWRRERDAHRPEHGVAVTLGVRW